MTDGMITAVVITNVLLGLMTLGIVGACVAGGCASLFRHRKDEVAHEVTSAKAA